MAEKIPESIGKYKIMGLVAKGGMGAVYKAVHPSLKRLVIIKKLTIRNNPTVRERFKREAQILLDMQSPYIVHLFDYFVEGSSHYIVEEFVDGLSLAQLLDKQVALNTEISLLIFLDACMSLKFAHARGIVHRDIKPGNILISKRAEVKLADFGIASSESGDIISTSSKFSANEKTKVDDNLTQSGVTLGTPAYMSPEQITDSSSVDKRADIFSMGVMLYEMLTGTKPFPSKVSAENLEKIKKGKFINPRKIDRSIPPFVCKMIKKMLRANPDRRYQSIEKVIDQVKKYLSHYNTHNIRIALAQAVISKRQISLPVFDKKTQKGRNILLGAILSGIMISGIHFLWTKGFFHQTVLSHWYSPVVLNLELPSNSSIDSDLPVRSFFFYDDGDLIPEVSSSRRVFYESEKYSVKNGEKIYVTNASSLYKNFQTKPVYLRPGKYRVKIAVGPYVIWQPLNVGEDSVTMDINFLKKQKRNVVVHTKAFDATTGTEITEYTEFFISYKGRWTNINQVPLQDIKTGSVIKFRARSEGYSDSIYSLILDWYQDELFLNATLEKQN